MSDPSKTASNERRSTTVRPTSQSLTQWLDEACQSNVTLRLSTATKPASPQERVREKRMDALAAMRQFDRDMNKKP
ncbi:hypothetical protein MCOR27_007453 [Pyricularia oryzae]|nr:hypothetical protein MCOR02_011868 [Pyricularia oryzae]KAI6255245.1 hypothetical protein MCOR19_008273 [Pyricularia oryzae]KAI6266796.1 hypothetical protein MCOR26_010011 [Pyricularia oryzae]KAI6274345.1 hypothetical protein MCOR27_007453 [Pyricularia oryzae]KAI6290312.1 hypothetical protein MCOR34_010466 [Pyricularia oryzae]